MCLSNLPETLNLEGTTKKNPESDSRWAKQDDWPETTWKLTPLP